MGEILETAAELDCLRCGHHWKRLDLSKLPCICPKCKSAYWDTPRLTERMRRHRKPKR